MRNIFDQYQQPENRLTHALLCTLANDRRLLKPFLNWLKIEAIPPLSGLEIVEQQVPGVPVSGEEDESSGLPDGCIYNEDGWAVLFEAKVQAPIKRKQLYRHIATAKRYGYLNPRLVVVAVDEPDWTLSDGIQYISWKSIYRWFSRRPGSWADRLVGYMEDFEAKMVSQNYAIRGTITMFDGLRFNTEKPYTYPEAKRLLRLLGDELQQRTDLRHFGVDPEQGRRKKITGSGADAIWDYLTLKESGGQDFTRFPHLTMAIARRRAEAATTIPHGIKGGLRTKLRTLGRDGFRDLLIELEAALRPTLRPVPKAKPLFYVSQRHFATRGGPGTTDGRIEFDLRTLTSDSPKIRHQPQWADAVFDLLANKRANMQCGVLVHFPYTEQVVRSRKVLDLYAKTWMSTKPLLDFVLP